ncbi:MAG: hypothetical protein IJO67_01500 [Clostridia bacterium]|nr:hypothetical protein [Clostridia bacterium]
MNEWVFFACVIALIGAGVLLMVDHRSRQREALRVERMRNSALYWQLKPLVEFSRRHDIDTIRVERDLIAFFSVCPPGKVGEFVPTQFGYAPLSAHKTLALAQLLAEDLPQLQSSAKYRFHRYSVIRPNGTKDNAYQYTIRSSYKTALVYERKHVRLW